MPYQHQHDLHTAYVQMCLERIELGYEPYMITLMFNPLPGSAVAVARSMDAATEALYSNILHRIFRHSDRMPITALPLWITCPDFPVSKMVKSTVRDVRVNDGRHAHINTLVPQISRLRLPFNLWLAQHADRFAGPGHAIARIHVTRITETPDRTFDYALKSLSRGRATSDDVLVLPRTRSEMQS
jgi:hypothetical protein